MYSIPWHCGLFFPPPQKFYFKIKRQHSLESRAEQILKKKIKFDKKNKKNLIHCEIVDCSPFVLELRQCGQCTWLSKIETHFWTSFLSFIFGSSVSFTCTWILILFFWCECCMVAVTFHLIFLKSKVICYFQTNVSSQMSMTLMSWVKSYFPLVPLYHHGFTGVHV